MYVVKRDGKQESVKFDKITARIQKLCYGLNADHVSSLSVAQKVIEGLYDGVTTTEPVSYTHLTLPTSDLCRSRWSPDH